MTIHWKAVEDYFIVVLFLFQFYPVFNFGKFVIEFLDLALSGVKGSISEFPILTAQPEILQFVILAL